MLSEILGETERSESTEQGSGRAMQGRVVMWHSQCADNSERSALRLPFLFQPNPQCNFSLWCTLSDMLEIWLPLHIICQDRRISGERFAVACHLNLHEDLS